MNDDRWKTTVTELMGFLRDAFVAVIPPLERAKIWPACYDDWDAIALALYHNIVIRTIEFALPGEPEGTIEAPSYEFTYDDYSDMSFVDVLHPSLSQPGYFAFVAWGTKSELFDRIDVASLSTKLHVVGHTSLPAEEATFRFQLRLSPGDLQALDELSVRL